MLNDSYERLRLTVEKLQAHDAIEFVISEKVGVVTSSPADVGTGMRCSVRLPLPGISQDGTHDKLNALCKDLGLLCKEEEPEVKEEAQTGKAAMAAAVTQFKALDVDKSGRLAGAELVKLAEFMLQLNGGGSAEMEITRLAGTILTAGDQDQDGEMDFPEFVAWYNRHTASGTVTIMTKPSFALAERDIIATLYKGVKALKEEDDLAQMLAAIQHEIDDALDDDIPFVKNKSVMKDPGPEIVNNVATVLKKYEFVHILVDGHAKGKKNTPYLQKLSESRAKSVHDYMVSQGVAASRLAHQGQGASGRGMHVFIDIVSIDHEELKRTSRAKSSKT